jgi:hypothetical protein
MKTSAALVCLLVAAAACARPAPAPAPPPAAGSGLDLRGRPGGDDDPGPLGVDPRVRERNEATRFPGVRKVGLVKVLISPLDRTGPCWTSLATAKDTRIRLEEALDADSGNRALTGIAALVEDGWRLVYRTPGGLGFERRADFRSIDLAVESEALCRCSAADGTIDGDRQDVSLRLRWTSGAMPEVSAKAAVDGEARGLRPALAPGALAGWEFVAARKLPAAFVGRCGARLELFLVTEPAVL